MDILNRVFQILRAHSPRNSPPDWEDQPPKAGGFEANGSSADQSTHTDPRQDPELARYYANLELPYGADLATVRRAWKRLLKQYHPDLHAQNKEKRQLANQLTAELTKAYQELEKALGKKETG